MIGIVDYGLGNVTAFLNVFRRLNIAARAAASAADLDDADRIILPGVGHFDKAMSLLNESGMRARLDELVQDRKVPVLGVCVGMQILAKSSEEGTLPGLGWIDGHVRGFASVPGAATVPVPHMGWNDVRPVNGDGLFDQLSQDARFYFLHSYFFECSDPHDSLAVSSYGLDFTCAVRSGNVHGVQFHPEKSHRFGTQLLRNFAGG